MMILELKNVSKTFVTSRGFFGGVTEKVLAVDNVSLSASKGSVTAVVGESGSGKTTLGKLICGLLKADTGSIEIDTANISNLQRKSMSEKVQMIFQNPYASLNPKLKVGTILSEALPENEDNSRLILKHTLERVGLSEGALNLYPHQFSGGQRQRIAIARALIKNPGIIVADEPLSSLDISIQNQLLNIFIELKKEKSLSFVFITHDIVVASCIADRIVVMQKGRVVEEGEPENVIKAPETLYTMKLISSVPVF
ncbi:MAG: ABC transporter ATP-binding protein [Endomicrobiales bacterium]|nr:ABC transporter ATP-binding protein [Endomicrobiales bacterium]